LPCFKSSQIDAINRHPKHTAAADISSRLSAQVLDAIEDAHRTPEVALSFCTPS
jgi:hypothetical protein